MSKFSNDPSWGSFSGVTGDGALSGEQLKIDRTSKCGARCLELGFCLSKQRNSRVPAGSILLLRRSAFSLVLCSETNEQNAPTPAFASDTVLLVWKTDHWNHL